MQAMGLREYTARGIKPFQFRDGFRRRGGLLKIERYGGLEMAVSALTTR